MPTRTVAQINAEIRRVTNRLGALRAERTAAHRAERRRLRALVPKEPLRWFGEALEALKADYESGRLLRLVARDHKTSIGNVANLAYANGWRRRPLEMSLRAFAAPPPPPRPPQQEGSQNV